MKHTADAQELGNRKVPQWTVGRLGFSGLRLKTFDRSCLPKTDLGDGLNLIRARTLGPEELAMIYKGHKDMDHPLP